MLVSRETEVVRMRHSLLACVSLLLLVPSLPTTPVILAGTGCAQLAADGAPLETRSPVRGGKAQLTSGFGLRRHPFLGVDRLHSGIDWRAPVGTAVGAAGKGRIVSADYADVHGNRVIIDHGGGWQTHYGNLARFSVRAGDCVEAGAGIGAVGSTGLSIEPHLHFEVRRGGEPVDPMLVPVKRNGIER
jgi:murein DD-endopeptidase MepM/ murein hydrolase activator NlpD